MRFLMRPLMRPKLGHQSPASEPAATLETTTLSTTDCSAKPSPPASASDSSTPSKPRLSQENGSPSIPSSLPNVASVSSNLADALMDAIVFGASSRDTALLDVCKQTLAEALEEYRMSLVLQLHMPRKQ